MLPSYKRVTVGSRPTLRTNTQKNMDDTIIQEFGCKVCGEPIEEYGICQDCIEAHVDSDGN